MSTPSRRDDAVSLGRTDVAVVGGGIAGLSAAHALRKAGVAFRLLEKSPRFGGVIRSDPVAGFLLEGGPDSLLAQKPEGIGLVRELGLGDRLVPTNPAARAVFVLHRGRLDPLPEGMMLAVPSRVLPFLRSPLFSWPGKIRMGLDLLRPGRRDDRDESIASFLRRRFGQEAVDLLGEPLMAGIHAGDPERLSIRATFPRFVDLEARHGSLIRGLWSSKRRAPAKGTALFYSLVGGLEEMVAALVASLPQASLSPASPIRSIYRDASGFVLDIQGQGALQARAVVLAAPAPALAPLLEDLDEEVGRTLGAIPFASTATVLLGYRRERVGHPLDGYGLLVTRGEGLRTTACSFFSTKFPGRAPEGYVLLRGFLGGTRDPDVLGLDDAALVETVGREMGPVLGIQGEPALARIYRWPHGTPQMEVGHLERVRSLEARLARVPGLFLTGAGIRVTGIPDSVADGLATGAAAADYVG
jgi:oxygen-dependent protoporphyrinogen oxidase